MARLARLRDEGDGHKLAIIYQPSAALAHNLGWPLLHAATSHEYYNTTIALQALHRLGYRRIGFCDVPGVKEPYFRMGEGAYLAYQVESVSGPDRLPVLEPGPEDLKAVRSWYATHRPDAVLSQHHRFRQQFQQLGLKLGQDLAYASMNRLEAGMAGIDLRHESIAEEALNLVADQLNRNERGLARVPRLILVPGTWEDGPSAPGLTELRTGS